MINDHEVLESYTFLFVLFIFCHTRLAILGFFSSINFDVIEKDCCIKLIAVQTHFR